MLGFGIKQSSFFRVRSGIVLLGLVFGTATTCFATFGDGTNGTDTIPTGLLKYGLYGKQWDSIGYAAKTSSYGIVGSDGYVSLKQNAVIRGDIISGGSVFGFIGNTIGDATLGVPATISANGPVTFQDGLNVVAGSIYTPDSITLNGAGGSNIIHGKVKSGKGIKLGYNNTFTDTLVTINDHIVAQQYQSNIFGGTSVGLGSRTQYDAINDAGVKYIKWNSAYAVPPDYVPQAYTIPTTTVTPGTIDCTVPGNGTWWNPTHCNAAVPYGTAANGKYYLKPGNYGTLTLGTGNTKIILGEGAYHFQNIVMTGNNDSIVVYQPTGGRTQILVNNTMTFSYQASLVPYDTTGNKGGTTLLYYAGTADLTIRQDNVVWATIIAPNALVEFANAPGGQFSAAYLYGQVFGNAIKIGQQYEGNNGRYIPFYPIKPLINLVFSGSQNISEGNSGTKSFPINFAMNHENGLPVTVYFHTQNIAPVGPGHADAADYTGTIKDSVVFAAGVTSVLYNGIKINGDIQFEADDYFNLVLDSTVNGILDSVPANRVYALGILNDDDPPVMTIVDTSTITVNESDGSYSVAIKLNASSIINAVATVTQSAGKGALAEITPSTATIKAGNTTGSFILSWTPDGRDAPNDTIHLSIQADSGVTVGSLSSKTIIIKNTDPTTTLSTSMQTAYTIAEPAGVPGTTATVKIPVTLAGVSGWDIPWHVKLVSGGLGDSATLSQDFTLNQTSGTIAKGSLSDTISVTVINDIYDEPDESFSLVFDYSMGKTAHLDTTGKGTITVTIPNNDGPVVNNDSVQIPEYPPNGYSFKRLLTMLSHSPDTTVAYDWRLLAGPDSAYFKVVKDPVQGWVIEIADSTVMNFVNRPSHSFLVQVQAYGAYHSATGTLGITLSYVQRAPIIDAKDTFTIAENSVAGTPADTVFPGDNSGWNLRWRIDGGSGASNFVVDSLTGIISVAPSAVLDYESTKTQGLVVILRNNNNLEDTLFLTAKLSNVLEYTQVSIVDVKLPDGQDFLNPHSVYTNQDNFTLTWNFEGRDTTELLSYTQDGVDTVIRTYCNPTKDFCGADTVFVRRNTVAPVVVWYPVVNTDTLPKYTVELPRTPGDTNIYVSDPGKMFGGKLTYTDSLGNVKTVIFKANGTLVEGQPQKIYYTYTDPYGNTVTDTISVVLDTKPPVVKILNPSNKAKFNVYNVNVVWTVDGVVMDTLNRASLEAGENKIVRHYVDLAGNVGADSIVVILNVGKDDINVALVNSMVVLDPRKVDQVAAVYPQRPNEKFTLTAINQEALQEEELAWGTTGKATHDTAGSQRVYQGTGNTHFGPTLRIEVKFQQVGGTNGEGTPRGGTVADLLERTRSLGIADSVALCGEVAPLDPYKTPIWSNSLQVETQTYDQLGQFIDDYKVIQDSITSKYLNDGGVGVFYFTLSPDSKDMQFKSSTGRALGTGAYIIRGMVKGVSTYLYCSGDYQKGQKVITSSSLLQLFGYRRVE